MTYHTPLTRGDGAKGPKSPSYIKRAQKRIECYITPLFCGHGHGHSQGV